MLFDTPEQLLIFAAQVLFIVLQILIVIRLSKESESSSFERKESKVSRTHRSRRR